MIKCFYKYPVYLLAAALCISSAAAQEKQTLEGEQQSEEFVRGPKPNLIKQEAKLDPNPGTTEPAPEPRPPGKQLSLFGGVVEKDLAIEWDNWHSQLVHAALPFVSRNFGELLNVPNGAVTQLHCEVTRDRHIKTVLVSKSSGSLWFDRMARDAVYRLDGHYLLTFPAKSQRTEVATDFTISKGRKTGGKLEFDDVEYLESSGDDAQSVDPTRQSSKRKHAMR
jgi:hypothetical protein